MVNFKSRESVIFESDRQAIVAILREALERAKDEGFDIDVDFERLINVFEDSYGFVRGEHIDDEKFGKKVEYVKGKLFEIEMFSRLVESERSFDLDGKEVSFSEFGGVLFSAIDW